MTNRGSPLFNYLEQFAQKKNAKLTVLSGRLSGAATDADLAEKFANGVKSFCETFAEMIPIYFEKEERTVFGEHYPLGEIAVAVREVLLSHFNLFANVWELYIGIFGRRDSVVLDKCMELADIRLADLGVKNKQVSCFFAHVQKDVFPCPHYSSFVVSQLWLSGEQYRDAELTLRQLRHHYAGSIAVPAEVLIQTSAKIVECVAREAGTLVALGGDDLLPLFAMLMLRAQLPHAASLAALLQHWLLPAEASGVAGYYCASFHAAIAVIEITCPSGAGGAGDGGGAEEEAERMQSRLTLHSRPVSPRPKE